MAIPGIHVAIHTEERLLYFSQHISTLVLANQMDEARQLWGSVFEVVHLAVDPALPVLQDSRLPRLGGSHAVSSPAKDVSWPVAGSDSLCGDMVSSCRLLSRAHLLESSLGAFPPRAP